MTELLNILVPALIIIESGGDCNALGSAGEIGCLQIKRITLDDCNRICELRGLPVRYTDSDRYDRAKSIEICKIILTEYGSKLPKEEQTVINLGLIWNCGFRAYREGKGNEQYASKIRAELAKKQVARR